MFLPAFSKLSRILYDIRIHFSAMVGNLFSLVRFLYKQKNVLSDPFVRAIISFNSFKMAQGIR